MKVSSVFWMLSGIGVAVQSLFTIAFFVTAKYHPQLYKVDWIPVAFLGGLCAIMLRLSNYFIKK